MPKSAKRSKKRSKLSKQRPAHILSWRRNLAGRMFQLAKQLDPNELAESARLRWEHACAGSHVCGEGCPGYYRSEPWLGPEAERPKPWKW